MKSFNDIRTKVELAESPLKEAMGHISAIQGMIAKERGLEKKRDATKSKDSGWQKPDSKQTAKPENRAKKLARGAMKSFKQVREDLKLVGLDEASLGEAKVGPSHDQIMKAIGHTQSSAQGMAILQKKFKLTAAQARKHMDMFLKDDVQIDEISMTKMADYAPKAVKSRNDAKSATSSADSNRRASAKKILDKRKTGANNYNKKMWGYGKVAPTK